MELHPLHKLYLGRSHGEVATLGVRAQIAEAAPAGRGSSALGSAPGRAVPAVIAALVALALANKLIQAAAGR